MLVFKYNNNLYNVDFNGIKIFEVNYTTNFIKQIISNNEISIDGRMFSSKNIIYINEMSKLSEFINMYKTNILYKKIIEYIGDESLVKKDVIDNVIKKINEDFGINDLLIEQYDLNKIIIATFEVNNEEYINDWLMIEILNKLEHSEKKLIIFDNCKYVDYNLCKKLLNNYHILIVCSDIRGIVNNYMELEICCFVGSNTILEIICLERLISYLEFNLSDQIQESDLNKYLSFDKSKKSSLINFYLKNI